MKQNMAELLNNAGAYLLPSLSCLMGAAVEFNNALFHIFSGPLFANLQGYVYLDLLVWGFSPILFELIRAPLLQLLKCNGTYITMSQIRSNNRKNRAMVLLALTGAIFVSFLFMNYSETFNWNYFSRIVNLDFGYILFDLACRSIQLIVQIQEEEIVASGLQYQDQIQQKKSHFQGYCKMKNLSMLGSYLLIFYLSIQYDVNHPDSGKHIFKFISIASCCVTVLVPLLYLLIYSRLIFAANYHQLSQQEDSYYNSYGQYSSDPNEGILKIEHSNVIEFSERIRPDNAGREYWFYGLINFSLMVNVSYFSLWILEGVQDNKMETSFQQFNKAVFATATFFMISSFLLFMLAQLMICLMQRSKLSKNISKMMNSLAVKVLLIGYGIAMMVVFAESEFAWHKICLLIIPFGFHYVLAERSIEQVDELQQSLRTSLKQPPPMPQTKMYFMLQTVTYFIFPLVLTICNISDYTLRIYGFASALSLMVAGFIR